jgi:superfamily II DNA or RNA helicase
MSFALRPYQSDCRAAIVDAWQRVDSVLVELATGLGKAQPLDASVATPFGFASMGSLSVGDSVIGSDGSPTVIRGVYPQGSKPVFRVTFSDGTSTECCHEHLWQVHTKSQKSRGSDGQVLSTWQLICEGLTDSSGASKWFVPLVKPVQFAASRVPCHPYLIGLLLGDGNTRKFIRFACDDEEILDRVREMVAPFGLHVRHLDRCDYLITHGKKNTPNPLTEILRRFGAWGDLAHDKAVPDIFRYNSVQVRLWILRGLMDTDGTVSKDGHAEFNTTSIQLAHDVAFIVRSLGGTTRIRSRTTTFTHKGEKRDGRKCYRVSVTLNGINPFCLKRKAERYKESYNQGQTKAIVSIERVGTKECQCISVEAADGLYVTDDFIVTHNTEVFTDIARTWEDGRVLVVCPLIQLIGQAAKKITKRTGVAPGIEQASLRANNHDWAYDAFIVASKQTLCTKSKATGKRRFEKFENVGLVIVDEAHLSITDEYLSFLDHFRAKGAKVLGVTATAKRHDKRAMGIFYKECPYQYGIANAVDDGWLVPAVTECVQLKTLDLSGVKTTTTTHGKDFNEKELNEKLEATETVYEIAEVTARESGKLKTAVYCSSVIEAQLVAERLADNYGIKADWICAEPKKCTDQRRQEVLTSFQEDPEGVQILCNVGILTIGWDFPGLEHIVMARPTKSLPLYTQIFGRGTRPLEGVVDFEGSTADSRRASIAGSLKPHFRVTDLVDASMEHKIVTSVDVLGGRYSVEVIERVKKAAQGAPIQIDQALLEEKRRLEEEREEAERKKRAQVQAKAEYAKVRVDPFDQFSRMKGGVQKKESGARFLFGKFKGRLVSEVPTWYLRGFGEKVQKAPQWLKTAVANELGTRNGTPVSKPASKPKAQSLDDINNLFMEARSA